ncbi:hypothetical protein HYI36_14835 [Bacillus sp. Gen3]|nr:hypothetical protein [Bacillus sp. Gen3]
MFNRTEILNSAIDECNRELQSLKVFIDDSGGHKNLDVTQLVINRIYFLEKQIRDLKEKQLKISN